MASYRSYVVCVLLFTVHSVHNVQITGIIKKNSGEINEVQVSEYVNGEDFGKVVNLTLNRLLYPETLSTLKLVNFQLIDLLELTHIGLEHVPVFENTSCSEIRITRNKIKSVPTYAFSEPRPSTLNLSKNEIQTMADRSVNIGATHVILSCNKLSHFSQTWFEDPGSVVLLEMAGNQIGYIEDRAFSRMTKLFALELSYNRITSIGREAFSYGIRILLLNLNNITQLTTDMFVRRESSIFLLELHHNQLSFLPEALLLKLKPEYIMLVGNPWQCQCLRDIERWLRELNSVRFDVPSRRGEPVCVVPRNFVNLCIPVVDTEIQETYARGLSPVPECLASPCKPCLNDKDRYFHPLH